VIGFGGVQFGAAGDILGLGVGGRARQLVVWSERARNPLTLIAVGAIALVTATLAGLPSARRATTADPLTSLRAE
jgi:ABC-type antimicrobial peptide transport system permease subunit